MITWETVRHQVCIAGTVTDAQTGRAIRGALVSLANGPAAFTGWLTRHALQYAGAWDEMAERPDRTLTARDGHFHFLDLPNGSYTLAVSLPDEGSRYGTAGTTIKVSRNTQGGVTTPPVSMTLPPTTLKGRITGRNNAPVILAEVRVQGSGEHAYSGAEGRYVVTGLEAGSRTVLVSAQGYQQTLRTVTLAQGQVAQGVDFALVSA